MGSRSAPHRALVAAALATSLAVGFSSCSSNTVSTGSTTTTTTPTTGSTGTGSTPATSRGTTPGSTAGTSPATAPGPGPTGGRGDLRGVVVMEIQCASAPCDPPAVSATLEVRNAQGVAATFDTAADGTFTWSGPSGSYTIEATSGKGGHAATCDPIPFTLETARAVFVNVSLGCPA